MEMIKPTSKIVLKQLCANSNKALEKWPNMSQIWKINRKIYKKNWRRNQLNSKEAKKDIEILSQSNLLSCKNTKDWSKN
jgi:hypothetical protein